MKTERRHELETNVVSAWINDQVERTRPYRTLILAGVVAVGALILVTVIVRTRSQAQQEESWQRYMTAATGGAIEVNDLVDVADDFPGTSAGRFALLRGADEARARGADALFRDRDEAKENLDRALELYDRAIEDAKAEPFFAEWASFGRAQTLECLMKLDDARTAYRTLIDKWPTGQYARLAEDRLKALDDPEAESFATWFRERARTMRPKDPFSDSTGLGGAFDSGSLNSGDLPGIDGFGPDSIHSDPPSKDDSLPAGSDSEAKDDEKGKDQASPAEESGEKSDEASSPAERAADATNESSNDSQPSTGGKAATDETPADDDESGEKAAGDSPAP